MVAICKAMYGTKHLNTSQCSIIYCYFAILMQNKNTNNRESLR